MNKLTGIQSNFLAIMVTAIFTLSLPAKGINGELHWAKRTDGTIRVIARIGSQMKDVTESIPAIAESLGKELLQVVAFPRLRADFTPTNLTDVFFFEADNNSGFSDFRFTSMHCLDETVSDETVSMDSCLPHSNVTYQRYELDANLDVLALKVGLRAKLQGAKDAETQADGLWYDCQKKQPNCDEEFLAWIKAYLALQQAQKNLNDCELDSSKCGPVVTE